MPRYDYRCPDGHVFEVVRSMRDESPAPSCVECSQQTRRVFAAPGRGPRQPNRRKIRTEAGTVYREEVIHDVTGGQAGWHDHMPNGSMNSTITPDVGHSRGGRVKVGSNR